MKVGVLSYIHMAATQNQQHVRIFHCLGVANVKLHGCSGQQARKQLDAHRLCMIRDSGPGVRNFLNSDMSCAALALDWRLFTVPLDVSGVVEPPKQIPCVVAGAMLAIHFVGSGLPSLHQ